MAKKKLAPAERLKQAIDDPQPNCAKCMFFELKQLAITENELLEGICRRYPPQPLYALMRSMATNDCEGPEDDGTPCWGCALVAADASANWSQTATNAKRWCGEYRSKVKGKVGHN